MVEEEEEKKKDIPSVLIHFPSVLGNIKVSIFYHFDL